MKNLLIGIFGGLALSLALFGPLLITVEPATPNGVNIMFGDWFGYHIATTTESN